MHRGKVGSLISPIKTYKPRKMEIWVFRDYATIMPNSLLSSVIDGQNDGEIPGANEVDGASRLGTESENKAPFIQKIGNHKNANTMGESMPLRGKNSSNIGR